MKSNISKGQLSSPKLTSLRSSLSGGQNKTSTLVKSEISDPSLLDKVFEDSILRLLLSRRGKWNQQSIIARGDKTYYFRVQHSEVSEACLLPSEHQMILC